MTPTQSPEEAGLVSRWTAPPTTGFEDFRVVKDGEYYYYYYASAQKQRPGKGNKGKGKNKRKGKGKNRGAAFREEQKRRRVDKNAQQSQEDKSAQQSQEASAAQAEQKADAIHWQAQSKQCQAKLGAAKALNLQLGQRYHKHKSLEVNAKWEFKEFRKRHKEGTVLHKQFVLQGLKPNWLRSKEEDTGRFKRPNPAAVSAELVALKGAEAAAEIENPANKPNVTNVNNNASNTTEALPEISPLHLDLGEVNGNPRNSTNSSNSDDEDGNEDGGDESLRPDDTDENDNGVDFGTSLELIQTATTRKPLRQQATLSLQSMLDAELNSMPDLQQSANEIYS